MKHAFNGIKHELLCKWLAHGRKNRCYRMMILACGSQAIRILDKHESGFHSDCRPSHHSVTYRFLTSPHFDRSPLSLLLYEIRNHTDHHPNQRSAHFCFVRIVFIMAIWISMSQATKRKHVTQQLLESYDLPADDQQIVRVSIWFILFHFSPLILMLLQVIGGRGNNIHEVENATGEQFLVSMPRQFRRNVWMKRG
jgi:hypothetical protein